MQKLFLLIGTLLGALSVIVGAFGAHGLQKVLEATNRQDTFETAVKYQFYHTFALILTALLMSKIDNKLLNYSGYAFITGIILFSGSLYALIATQQTKFGAITPIGGLAFVIGWVFLFIACLKGL